MQRSFTGTLHHKETKAAHTVSIRLEQGSLVLEYNGTREEWRAADIQSYRLVNDGSVILQSGSRFLDVREPGFDQALEYYFNKKHLFRRSFFDRIGLMGCLLAIGAVILPLLIIFLWLIPFLADRAAQNVSPEVEQEIGDSWYQSLTATYRIDTTRSRMVQQFYDSLHFGGAYPIKITVVHEPVVNAFAVPGGHIVVFDSILGIMDRPDQLAGLLAHEASHIQLKHSTRAIFRELANQLFISIIFGDAGSFSAIVAQHGGQLAGLSYSRALELEADAHGLDLLEHSGVSPGGMPSLFRKMQAAVGQEMPVPTFLSTHPAIAERIRIAEEKIAQKGQRSREVPAALDSLWLLLKRG